MSTLIRLSIFFIVCAAWFYLVLTYPSFLWGHGIWAFVLVWFLPEITYFIVTYKSDKE